jgi:hypothetical protein
MWWLQFEEGNAAVVAATSLVQARLIAASQGLGRASKFVEGHLIDDEFLRFIPSYFIGKELSKDDASEVLEQPAASCVEIRLARSLDEKAQSHPASDRCVIDDGFVLTPSPPKVLEPFGASAV